MAPLIPSVGTGVLHLFCKLRSGARADRSILAGAAKAASADEVQLITFGVLGHKADVGLMALHPDLARLRLLQSEVQAAGLEVRYSYVSLTEVSEYAKDMSEAMKRPRLYPRLPPEGKRAICFYPMSKRREVGQNWYQLPYEERRALMSEHAASGRGFSGRVLQLVTGSAGLDDYEWGVTLFGERPDDLKDVVYGLRFDEVSARFAEFGPFYFGVVGSLDEVADMTGLE
ncbi:MAG: chlorite dismutase family protein [Acidimicrobiales bacterium]